MLTSERMRFLTLLPLLNTSEEEDFSALLLSEFSLLSTAVLKFTSRIDYDRCSTKHLTHVK